MRINKIEVKPVENSINPELMFEMDIDVLADQIRKCRKCPLHEKRKYAVPGEGPKYANIIFIGEAPGKEEDLQGRPFIGRAGRLLDEVLRDLKISRKDVFITSILKCRPESNRNPRAKEIKTCLPYTKMQINAIEPKVICILGRIALNALLGIEKISKARGEVIERDWVYVPTFHPAAVLRDPRLRETLLKDLEKAKKLCE